MERYEHQFHNGYRIYVFDLRIKYSRSHKEERILFFGCLIHFLIRRNCFYVRLVFLKNLYAKVIQLATYWVISLVGHRWFWSKKQFEHQNQVHNVQLKKFVLLHRRILQRRLFQSKLYKVLICWYCQVEMLLSV